MVGNNKAKFLKSYIDFTRFESGVTMRTTNYTSIVPILIAIFIIVWEIYRNYFRPLRNINDYIERAVNYELINADKAIKILKDGLTLKNLTEGDLFCLFVNIGNLYYKRKGYTEVTTCYEQAVEIILGKDFYYDSSIAKIIKAYFYSERIEEAQKLYNNFLLRVIMIKAARNWKSYPRYYTVIIM